MCAFLLFYVVLHMCFFCSSMRQALGQWPMGFHFDQTDENNNRLTRHNIHNPPGGGETVTCSNQNCSLQLTVLLSQNHHPRVLPKVFQWKVVSMCKSSRLSGAGPRKFTPSWSRSRSPYIGSPLNVSYAEFFRFMLQFLCLQMCAYGGSAVPQGGWGTVIW